jgi:hypothetical protein
MHPEHRRDYIHDFVDRFVIAHKRGPTWQEIITGLDFSYETVRVDLRVLRSVGRVTWRPNTPYTLRAIYTDEAENLDAESKPYAPNGNVLR